MTFKLSVAIVLALGFCMQIPDADAAQGAAARNSAQAAPCCGPVSPAGMHILKVLDDSNVEALWLNGRHINWETGEPDKPADYVGPETKSHCSAYVAAIGERLGVYVLRPPQHSQELLANAQTAWFDSTQGAEAGWHKVDTPEQAQTLANQGTLVVVSYRSADPHRPGHIGIVRPDARRTQTEIDTDGVWMSQAGETNYLRVAEKTAFKHHPGAWPDGVRYFAHEVAAGPGS